MPFSNFIRWEAIIVLIFISKGLRPGVFFSQFCYLKITSITNLQLLQQNIQDCNKQVQTFFWSCFLLKFLNTEVSIRIPDHWSHYPENNLEGKFSVICPDNWWLSCVWQIAAFIPLSNMRKCFPLLVYFEVIQVWLLRVILISIDIHGQFFI